MLASRQQKEQELKPVLVLVTDGRANTAAAGGDGMADALQIAEKINIAGVHSVVIDTESDFVKLGLARIVAGKMGSTYYSLRELAEHNIMNIVKKMT